VNNGQGILRTESSQQKPPTVPQWAVDAGFEAYVLSCRSGNIPSNRPSFIGKGLEIWQVKYLIGLSNPSKAAKWKSQARDRRKQRLHASTESFLSLAEFIAKKAVR
jgi:hypothetical protein